MTPASPRRHGWRRACQIALLLLGVALPWLDLFRLDVAAQRVMYLGRSYPLGWPYVLGIIVPFLAVVWGLALLSLKAGRVFCGWACPYGSLVEFFEGLRTALGRGTNRKVAAWMRRSALHRWGLRGAALLTLLVAPLILGTSLAAYLYPPERILRDLATLPRPGHPGPVVLWAFLALVWVLSMAAGFLVRFHFCRMVCIYGMGQAMAASSGDGDRVLRPRYRPESLSACGSCQACLKACYLELDPREKDIRLGFSNGCFNCGDCVDVCQIVKGHKGQAALLTFQRLPRRRSPKDPSTRPMALEEDGVS